MAKYMTRLTLYQEGITKPQWTQVQLIDLCDKKQFKYDIWK